MTRFSRSTMSATLALVAAVFATPVAAIQPIDCSIDLRAAAERTICQSQHLQILDAQLTQAYADYMLSPRVDPGSKIRLRESQHRFLQRRNTCGADRACLEEVMSLRLTRLHNVI